MRLTPYLTGTAIGELVNAKQLKPIEVVEYFLERVEAKNKDINAFVYTMYDDAIAEAYQLEHRIMRGEYVGPFAGVPTALKDFLPSKKGWTNTHGGVPSLTGIDDADSEFYRAAKSLGAIAIGKTNAPPFGFSGTTDNYMYGPTRNPFNLDYNSGGSSGGTAAAVAAGLIPFGEGGDAGGSIRIPSGWCNCFGFKAGFGTIPSVCRPDGWTATHPYCVNGAITRTVEDSATMLNAMSRYDPKDPYSIPIACNKDYVELMKHGVEGKRIAVTYDFDLFETDMDIGYQIGRTSEILADAGAIVDVVDFNFKYSLPEFADMWCKAISVDTAIEIRQWAAQGFNLMRDHKNELPEKFIEYDSKAASMNIFDMYRFNCMRTNILDNFEDIFKDHDLILAPVAACDPIKNNLEGFTWGDRDDVIGYSETFLVNFAGYPAASVPIGLSSNNLPIGGQLISKKFDEESILQAAYVLETQQPWDKYYTMIK